jgi:beta-phosphoglucomutase-like phosphatase (HAD superfamily)
VTALAALIFDVDGTLAETEEAHRQAFNEAFAAAGLDWRWDPALYRRLLAVAGGVERIRHFMATQPRRLTAAALAALHRDKTARFAAHAAAQQPRPGVARLIAGARATGCLALEDTRNGVAAARAAGIPVLVTRSQYGERDGFAGAVAVVDELVGVGLDDLRRWHAER